jgi:hypothetical protein
MPLLTKKSMFTGSWNQREINVTEEQVNRWQTGELIQDVMPNLSADDREFLMTGSTPDEWNEAFGGDEDDV